MFQWLKIIIVKKNPNHLKKIKNYHFKTNIETEKTSSAAMWLASTQLYEKFHLVSPVMTKCSSSATAQQIILFKYATYHSLTNLS